jgi:Polynucleotide kinase 3 phosphatase
MDGTIITPKSGKTFGADEYDWKFWDKVVPDVLLRHHREGQLVLSVYWRCYNCSGLSNHQIVHFILKEDD